MPPLVGSLRPRYFRAVIHLGQEGCAMSIFCFVHYRQRGPVNALQMRLQG